MRLSTLVVIAAVGLAIVLFMGVTGGSGIGPETRITVLTTDPVRVLLPVDASASFIESRVREELATSAASERDARTAGHIRDLAQRDDLMRHVATDGFDQFDGDIAAGIAYGFYDAAIDDDVTLFSITIELLPSFYGVGNTLSHEDGHWLVNTGVAERCGPRIVREAGSGTLFPGRARAEIVFGLQEVDEAVHDTYHRLVAGATAGQHRVAALQALDDVVGPVCEHL